MKAEIVTRSVLCAFEMEMFEEVSCTGGFLCLVSATASDESTDAELVGEYLAILPDMYYEATVMPFGSLV